MTTYYSVEFRNMRTAVHGLFIYEDENIAFSVDDALSEYDENECVAKDIYAPQRDEFEIDPCVMPDEWSPGFNENPIEINYRGVVFDEKKIYTNSMMGTS